jgi:hypothetical protein
MNSFGVKFTGRAVDELSISKIFEENRNTVWRRILNNLPYILKSSGTEESLRALFRCYGIPDYLFSIREYGGMRHGTDATDDDATFRIDTHDYALKFTEPDQYIEVPLQPDKVNEGAVSIELRVSIDTDVFKTAKEYTSFNPVEAGKIPSNMGWEKPIDKIIEESDFLIGSKRPRFYSKRESDNSYIHPGWDVNSDIALSWKNFREGVSFSYPKVASGNIPAFMTIYSDEAKLGTNHGDSRDYDPIHTLAEIGAQETLNGQVVRLLFNQGLSNHQNTDNKRNQDFYIDFMFRGTTAGVHMTISELREGGSQELRFQGYFPIIHTPAWEFGVYRDENNYPDEYGKFYFNLNNSDGTCMCPSTLSNPIYFGENKEYDILITKSSEDHHRDSELKLVVKRVYDADILFEDSNSILISSYSSRRIMETEKFTLGNFYEGSFLGTLDRLRVYAEEISESRFTNHINHNQGYDIDDSLNLKDNLIVKVNFDYPYDIHGDIDSPGKIKNYILDDDESYISAVNFTTTDFPYDFTGKSRREHTRLPTFGAQVFNNNKIRI